MTYTCAQCAIHACSRENPAALPQNCPMRDTTLVAKDRALGHNPAAAIYCAEGYFRDRIL